MTTVTVKKQKKMQRETARVLKQLEMIAIWALNMLKTPKLEAQKELLGPNNTIITMKSRKLEIKTSSLRLRAKTQLLQASCQPKVASQSSKRQALSKTTGTVRFCLEVG